MPIYAYRCESCGFEKDVLQKMSDAPLTQCPECLSETFRKQVTAAGFQLKGSGWYVTDFRGGSNGANSAKGEKGEKGEKGVGDGKKEAGESKAAAATDSSSASAASSTAASSTSDA